MQGKKDQRGATNTLYYGDNLDVLRRYIKDESVDLVYLDPPFNSQRNYNAVFKGSEAQVNAFNDTWGWGPRAQQEYDEILKAGGKLADTVSGLRTILGENDMLAYLCMMAPRLAELRRVLRSTGSIYLHCDPTASHYLKILLDSTFHPENFRSEIVWRRKTAHNKLTRQFGPIHDTILFYTKSDKSMFHPGRRPYPKSYIEGRFKGSDDKGLFRQQTLTGAGVSHGSSGEAWRGFDPTERGRHWAIAGSLKKLLPNGGENMTLQQKLDYLADQPDSAIEMPKSESGMPTYKQYIGTGVPYQDIWAYQPGTRGILFGTEDGIDEDVAWLEDGDEKTGFQTQKPRGLLKRIIESSTDTGQVVLDPFCGCGTAIAAAQSLRRRWVGIDITHVAVSIIRARLTADGVNPRTYEVVGLPKDEAGAEELFTQDPYQFQAWACGLAGVHPNMRDGKPQKGADQGIDGRLRYQEVDGTERLILAQVKGGKTSSRDIRDLSGTMRRQNATFGFFITLNDATKEMTKEAASVGTYRPAQASLTRSEPYMRLQVRTVKQLLDGEKFDYPAPH